MQSEVYKHLWSKQFKAATNSNHTLPVAENLLKQQFAVEAPNQLIHHSDRGSQHCSAEYRKLLKQFGLIPSMSRRDSYYDNAPMESFWGTLKNELVYHRRYRGHPGDYRVYRSFLQSGKTPEALGLLIPSGILEKVSCAKGDGMRDVVSTIDGLLPNRPLTSGAM